MQERIVILGILFSVILLIWVVLLTMRIREDIRKWIVIEIILIVILSISVFIIYWGMPSNEVEYLIRENNTIKKLNNNFVKRHGYSERKIDSLERQIKKVKTECKHKTVYISQTDKTVKDLKDKLRKLRSENCVLEKTLDTIKTIDTTKAKLISLFEQTYKDTILINKLKQKIDDKDSLLFKMNRDLQNYLLAKRNLKDKLKDFEFVNKEYEKNIDLLTELYGKSIKELMDIHFYEHFKGKVAYHIPDTMIRNEISFVTLTISKSKETQKLRISVANLRKDIPQKYKSKFESKIVIDTLIEIGRYVDAKLTDAASTDKVKDFTIKLLGDSSTQPIFIDKDSISETKWKWAVTPLTSGKKHLSLSISILSDTAKITKNFQPYEQMVFVKHNYGRFGSILKIMDELQKRNDIVLALVGPSGIIVLIVVWIFGYLKRRKTRIGFEKEKEDLEKKKESFEKKKESFKEENERFEKEKEYTFDKIQKQKSEIEFEKQMLGFANNKGIVGLEVLQKKVDDIKQTELELTKKQTDLAKLTKEIEADKELIGRTKNNILNHQKFLKELIEYINDKKLQKAYDLLEEKIKDINKQ